MDYEIFKTKVINGYNVFAGWSREVKISVGVTIFLWGYYFFANNSLTAWRLIIVNAILVFGIFNMVKDKKKKNVGGNKKK